MPKTISYLRASTADQDLEKYKNNVLKFSNDRDLGRVSFVEEKVSGTKPWTERKIKEVLDQLGEGDRIVVPELSRLARSTLQVLEILRFAKEKGVAVYSIKEGLDLSGDGFMTEFIKNIFAAFVQLERDIISERTKEGLAAVKAKGVKLGRPKGPGKSKLDPHREEITALLKNGSTKTYVSRRYGTTEANLYNWLKQNQIDVG